MPTKGLRHFKMKIVLLYLVFLKYIKADSAWFQVCDTKQKYALNSVDCEMGLWLKTPITVDCVCVNGIWIVSEDLCDNDAMLIVGKGDCFTLRRKIRSVKLLGSPDNPFGPATYIASENLDSIEEVPPTGYNNKLKSPSSIVISVNPRWSIRRSDHQVCLSHNKKYSKKPVHIWRNSRRVSSRFKFEEPAKCENPMDFDSHVGFGEIFQGNEILFGDSVTQNCASKCLATPENSPRGRVSSRVSGRGLGGDLSPSGQSYTRINWEGLYTLNKGIDFSGGSSLTESRKQVKMNWYKFRWNITLPALSHSRETREQSVRMIQAQTNFLLLNQPPPKVNTFEYDYFQKLRQIFVALAPPDVIDPYIVNGLMRMFRLLLWESHDKFEFREDPDPVQYDRIMKVLNECLYDVAPTPMVFTNRVTDNETIIPRANSTHNCLNDTVEVYWNNTIQDSDALAKGIIDFVHTDKNVSGERPAGRKEIFDPKKYDFVIELAWKIYLFGFYRCQHKFKEVMTDYHELAETVMSLFNHKIIKRWYNSQDFNTLLPLLFPKLNQTVFAWAVDKLAIGARESEYGWTFMQRKPIPITRPDIPFDDALAGYRKKRSPRRSKSKHDSFWSNKAHCIFSYSDPVKKFKYAGKQDCYL